MKTMPELIAYAKANPGKLKYGTPGAASPHHLAGELLALKAGIDIEQVPYRGGGPATNDLIGGHIPMAFLSLSSAVPQMPSGKIRIVALIDKSRYFAMPHVPTIGETIPGFELSSWLGVFAPAATATAGRPDRRCDHQDLQRPSGEGKISHARTGRRFDHPRGACYDHQKGYRGARRFD